MKTFCLILFILAAINLLSPAAEPGLFGKKLKAIHIIQNIPASQLRAADTNAPAVDQMARRYFVIKIRTCTNDLQIAAITNAVNAARPLLD